MSHTEELEKALARAWEELADQATHEQNILKCQELLQQISLLKAHLTLLYYV